MLPSAQKTTPTFIIEVNKLVTLRKDIIACHTALALAVNIKRNDISIQEIRNPTPATVDDIKVLFSKIKEYNDKRAEVSRAAPTDADKIYLDRVLAAEKSLTKSPPKKRFLSAVFEDLPYLENVIKTHDAKKSRAKTPSPSGTRSSPPPLTLPTSTQPKPDTNNEIRAIVLAAAATPPMHAKPSCNAGPDTLFLNTSTAGMGTEPKGNQSQISNHTPNSSPEQSPRLSNASPIAPALENPSADAIPTKPPLKAPKPINLEEQKGNFNKLLNNLSVLNQRLLKRQNANKSYDQVVKAGEVLHTILTKARDEFFETPRKLTYEEFKNTCTQALETADKEFRNHRGWHALNSVVRAFLGFLSMMTLIPALAVAQFTRHGCVRTFFRSPATNSKVALDQLTEEFSDVDESLPNELKKTTESQAKL